MTDIYGIFCILVDHHHKIQLEAASLQLDKNRDPFDFGAEFPS